MISRWPGRPHKSDGATVLVLHNQNSRGKCFTVSMLLYAKKGREQETYLYQHLQGYLHVYVLYLRWTNKPLPFLCVILIHQFVPGFRPDILAQRWMRSAFYLPGDPLNTATCAVQAFLRELTIVTAWGSIGSFAESLFPDHFLSSIEIWGLYTAKSVFNSSGSHPMTLM